MQHEREDAKRAPNAGAGFMQLRNSQNKSLQQTKQQMSAGVLSPLKNNGSMSAFNSGQSNPITMPNKRESVQMKMPEPSGNSNFRNNMNGI